MLRMFVSLCVFAAGALAGFFLTALVRLRAGRPDGRPLLPVKHGGPRGAAKLVVLRHFDAFLGLECRGGPLK